jgi:hypothetical protein
MIVCGRPRVNIFRWVNVGQACATVSLVSYFVFSRFCGSNEPYLLKDELEYELRVHGILSFGDVSLLRVRSVISSFLPSQSEKFLSGDAQEDFRLCVRKLSALEQ